MKKPRISPLVLSVVISMQVTTLAVPAALTWVPVNSSPTNANLLSITYGNGQYVAVATGGVFTSPDGIAWTSRSSAGGFSVTYGNGRYVVARGSTGEAGGINGYEISNYISASTDGKTWNNNSYSFYCVPCEPSGWNKFVMYDGSRFVALSQDFLFSSNDGLSWQQMGINYLGGNCIAYGNGTYVSVDNLGIIYALQAFRVSGTTRNLNYTTYGNGQFVVVGDSGTILTSSNDSDWIGRGVGINNNLQSVTYGNGQYVTVGSSGAVLNSQDGTNWVSDLSATSSNLNSVIYGDGKYVAVGNNGTIIIAISANKVVTPTSQSLPHAFSITCSSGIVCYSLPMQCRVSMKYYDLQGRLIATLVNSMQGTGFYTLNALSLRGAHVMIFKAGPFVKRELSIKE